MKEGEGIIRLLSTLLSISETVENRKQILEHEFEIPMTEEMEKEMSEMCNLGYAVENKGRREGLKEGRREGQKEMGNLMNFLWSSGRGEEAKKVVDDQKLYERLLAEYKRAVLTPDDTQRQ